MGRLSRVLTSRITLALVGVLLVGGAGGMWAATSGGIVTPSIGAAQPLATVTFSGQLETPSPSDDVTSTPVTSTRAVPTRTPKPGGAQSVHWNTTVLSVSASSFVVRVAGVTYTIMVNSATQWSGPVTTISTLRAGYNAELLATLQSGATYLASDVNAQPDT